ncbi:MAG: TspO/MBR family protein [Solirubrobacterales bacterium]
MSGKSVVRLLTACGVSLAAGLIGSFATMGEGFNSWYSTIEKPGFTPPGWIFGPVWTILYLLMGVAAFLVWQKGIQLKMVRIALGWFLVQLILNTLWSPVFFGLHQIGWALAVIVVLWIAIVVTLYCFSRASRAAAALLIPYLLWVSFATVLNGSIWWLNR